MEPHEIANQKGGARENSTPKNLWLYRMIIAALGITLVATVGGAIVLASTGQSASDAIIALGAAAIGGMAGFLVPTHLSR
jgi:hypothetical protein